MDWPARLPIVGGGGVSIIFKMLSGFLFLFSSVLVYSLYLSIYWYLENGLFFHILFSILYMSVF